MTEESNPVVVNFEDPPPPQPPTRQTIPTPDALTQTLYLLECFGVSDEFYHKLTRADPSLSKTMKHAIFYITITDCCGFVLTCRSYRVKQMRSEITHSIEIEHVPAPYHSDYQLFAAFITAVLLHEVRFIVFMCTLLVLYLVREVTY